MMNDVLKIFKQLGWLSLICLGIILFLRVTALALDAEQPIPLYIHEVWQTENGLPQNNVRSILQTQNGYIWLATEEGLARFDGTRFTVFDKQNTDAIKSNSIQVLFEDHNGNLWIGTDKGLLRWKNEKFSSLLMTDGLSNDNISSISESREGDLWIGTQGGLNRLHDGKITSYTVKDGLPDSSIGITFEDQSGSLWVTTAVGLSRFDGSTFITPTSEDGLPPGTIGAIYQTGAGELWFGTSSGLAQYKDGRFTIYSSDNGLLNNKVWSIHEDREGYLWIGTDGGLNRFKGGRFTTFTTKDGLSDNTVWSIFEDHHGTLWFGTPGGLTRYQGGRFSTYTIKDGLSKNVVLAIMEDMEGNLWVGTEAGGLNVFKDRKFFTFSLKDGLASDMVWTVREGPEGGLWVGTQDGLSRFKDGKFTSYTIKDGLPSNIVRALCPDHEGNLWIGTPDGLSQYKDGRFITYRVEDGLSSNAIWAIHEDQAGNLWVGTLAGLTRIREGKFTVYTTKDGLTDDRILSLQSGSHGELWIGTRNGGLILYRENKFTTYALDNGLSDNNVRAIYEDHSGTIWAGTRRGGLNRIQDGKITSYTTKDGLFDDCVFQILEDERGSLWMSCAKGIFRVALQDLNDFADGKKRSLECIAYGMADGMLTRECNGGQPAGWKSRDGKLWFPTIKGIAMIDPQAIRLNEQPPPVVIEQVIADNSALEIGKKGELSAGLGSIEFHYAGLSFAAPEKVRFKYKLEGFDANWIDAGTRRVAYYTSIPPGDYKFLVQACNNDGVWNEVGSSFVFYLKPHFYQTIWFYGLLTLSLVGLGLALYRLRIKQVKAQFSAVLGERTRLAREIHDTLAQGFVGIGLQLQAVGKMLTTSPQAAQQHLDLAQKMVSHSLEEARRTVWNLRPQMLEGGDLASALSETARQLTAGTSVEAEIKVVGTPHPLASAIESNLLRIGQEAITNAMKHARADKLEVALTYDTDCVRLSIADNGRGFDTDHVASSDEGHFGLLGMRERIERLKGELSLQSHPDQGTAIMVVIPLR